MLLSTKMVIITCEYCGKTLSSISALNVHKKTAKYCLKVQNRTLDTDFVCQFCNNKSSTKQKLETHQKSCKKNKKIIETDNKKIDQLTKKIDKLTDKNNNLKMENKRLKKLVADLTSQNKLYEKLVKTQTTNNMTINNTINVQKLVPFTTENLESQFKMIQSDDYENKWKFTKKVIESAVDMILCTDTSRKKFAVNIDDKAHVDTGGYNILNRIFEVIRGIDSYTEYIDLINSKKESASFKIDHFNDLFFIRDLVNNEINRFNITTDQRNFVNLILTELAKATYNDPISSNDIEIYNQIQNPDDYRKRSDKEVGDDLEKYDIPTDFRNYLKFVSFEDIKKCVYSQTIDDIMIDNIMKCRQESFKKLVKEYEGFTF